MIEETITAEEIKAQMEVKSPTPDSQSESQVKEDSEKTIEPESSFTENEEKEVPKLSLNKRLENAYQNLTSQEREAWSQGWRPKEFFVGKKRDGTDKEWINAETFLSKSKDTLPIANDIIRKLTKRIEQAEKNAKEVNKRIHEAEKEGYKKALVDIATKQREAVELSDTEEFDRLKKQESDLINSQLDQATPSIEEPEAVVEDVLTQQPNQQVNQPQPVQLSPRDQEVLNDWQTKNTWIRTDPKLAAYAIESERQLLTEKPYLSLEERLQIVGQEVKEVFHQKFNTPNSAPMFDSGGNAGFGDSTPKQRGYSDLPNNVKKLCENAIRTRRIDLKGEEAVKTFRKTYVKAHFATN